MKVPILGRIKRNKKKKNTVTVNYVPEINLAPAEWQRIIQRKMVSILAWFVALLFLGVLLGHQGSMGILMYVRSEYIGALEERIEVKKSGLEGILKNTKEGVKTNSEALRLLEKLIYREQEQTFLTMEDISSISRILKEAPVPEFCISVPQNGVSQKRIVFDFYIAGMKKGPARKYIENIKDNINDLGYIVNVGHGPRGDIRFTCRKARGDIVE